MDQGSWYVDQERSLICINIQTGSKIFAQPAGGGLVRVTLSSVNIWLGAKKLEFRISYLSGYSISTALIVDHNAEWALHPNLSSPDGCCGFDAVGLPLILRTVEEEAAWGSPSWRISQTARWPQASGGQGCEGLY